MKKRISKLDELKPAEGWLIEQLRVHPEIMDRFKSILEITSNGTGPLKTADEVEELLNQEIRKLGNTSMGHWAKGAEERVSQELKQEDPTLRSRKKNAEVVVPLWAGKRAREELAPLHQKLREGFASALGSQTSRAVQAVGESPDRFRM